MVKKYEFTGETKAVNGRILRRIRRLSDGEIGGWIEHEQNLSHEGTCWVADDAKVFANARVYDDALVCGNVSVYGNASVYDRAVVSEHAAVYDDARIYGVARINGCARAYGRVRIGGVASVGGSTRAHGNVCLVMGTWFAGHVHQPAAADATDTAIPTLPTYDVVEAALRHILDLPDGDTTPLNAMLAAVKHLRVSLFRVDLPYLRQRLGEADQRVAVGGYLSELYWPQYKLRWYVSRDMCCGDNGNHLSTTAALELEIARQGLANKGA